MLIELSLKPFFSMDHNMRSTDRTGLVITLSLFSLALFDEMGLVIEHLSATYSAT